MYYCCHLITLKYLCYIRKHLYCKHKWIITAGVQCNQYRRHILTATLHQIQSWEDFHALHLPTLSCCRDAAPTQMEGDRPLLKSHWTCMWVKHVAAQLVSPWPATAEAAAGPGKIIQHFGWIPELNSMEETNLISYMLLQWWSISFLSAEPMWFCSWLQQQQQHRQRHRRLSTFNSSPSITKDLLLFYNNNIQRGF